MGEHDNVSRDQHRADLAELRLELSGTLASLDKRTELDALSLGLGMGLCGIGIPSVSWGVSCSWRPRCRRW